MFHVVNSFEMNKSIRKPKGKSYTFKKKKIGQCHKIICIQHIQYICVFCAQIVSRLIQLQRPTTTNFGFWNIKYLFKVASNLGSVFSKFLVLIKK